MNQDELSPCINNHELWLNSNGIEGSQFTPIDLSGVDIKNTNLQKADFSKAENLFPEQLAGSNLKGTKLPEDFYKQETLDNIAETSKKAQSVFLIMLLGSLYCLLTVVSTTLPAFFNNTPSVPLPILQTKIPIVYFYWVAPLYLLGTYAYFHSYILRLWERLAKLPNIFPDGESLRNKVYPWLLNDLASQYHGNQKNTSTNFQGLQNVLVLILAWAMVPITILFFIWKSFILPGNQGWWLNDWQLAVCIWSIGIGTFSYRHGIAVLRGKKANNSNTKPFYFVFIGVFIIASLSLNILEKKFQIKGNFSGKDLQGADFQGTSLQGIKFQSAGLERAKINFAEWSDINLSQAQLQYAELKNTRFIDSVLNGANFTKADLSGADLRDAELGNVNFRGATLIETIFIDAKIKNTKFAKANLTGAIFTRADLKDANFYNSILEGAVLIKANLTSVWFVDTNLINANLLEANLINTNLKRANLTNANLGRADLTDANLKEAKLENVDMTTTKGLLQMQIDQACVKPSALLPEGLKKPEWNPECEQFWLKKK
jgi:uncharacterized protein YjbI with pentapeptide repeats